MEPPFTLAKRTLATLAIAKSLESRSKQIKSAACYTRNVLSPLQITIVTTAIPSVHRGEITAGILIRRATRRNGKLHTRRASARYY